MRTLEFFKKFVATVLSAGILLTTAACSNNQPTNSDTASSVTENSDSKAKVTISGSEFMVDGKKFWINGVNTPWDGWNDFLGNMNEEFWDKTFETLVKDGINCTRIWVNCDGEGVVRLKSTGEIIEINEMHWGDLDKLFALAAKHKIYLMPTLLSFDHFKAGSSATKWQALVKSDENCDQFAEKYVREFCKRYGEHPYLFGIDLMNEPDWVHENQECGKIGWRNLCYLFGKCCEVIHETCSTPVTVGMGIVKYNSDKYEGDKISDYLLKTATGSDKAYVDFYSTHFYTWQMPHFGGIPFDKSPEEYGLVTEKPCLIGETSNDQHDTIGMTVEQMYKSSYEKGWQGVMVWMQTQNDKSWYEYDLTVAGTNAMKELIPEEIDPLNQHNYKKS